MIRIICADPNAEGNDYFAIVGIALDITRKHIYPKLAWERNNMPFEQVAKEFKGIYNSANPKFFGMEINNEGKRAVSEFRKAGMDVNGIATVHHLTDRNRFKWQSMDKPYTVEWLRQMKFDQKIIWPAYSSSTMKKLEDQIAQIRQYGTPNGSTTYKARNSRHDDLFMAFLLCCHMARIYTERDES